MRWVKRKTNTSILMRQESIFFSESKFISDLSCTKFHQLKIIWLRLWHKVYLKFKKTIILKKNSKITILFSASDLVNCDLKCYATLKTDD